MQRTPDPTDQQHPRKAGGVDVPVLLGRWRERELRRARAFRACSGLSTAELAEILDSTTLALLDKHYDSQEHLLAALHRGIKLRALRAHRDRGRHHRDSRTPRQRYKQTNRPARGSKTPNAR